MGSAGIAKGSSPNGPLRSSEVSLGRRIARLEKTLDSPDALPEGAEERLVLL